MQDQQGFKKVRHCHDVPTKTTPMVGIVAVSSTFEQSPPLVWQMFFKSRGE